MIKVGDWVKREHAEGIARVISIEEDMAVLYTGGVQSCEYLEELTKLPIKFKGFEIVLKFKEKGVYGWSCFRYNKNIGVTYFQCAEIWEIYCVNIGISDEECKFEAFRTIDQARDWLELQYATMLAKARGLV